MLWGVWVFFLTSIFIYLATPGLSCGMQDLVPWPEIEPWLPALGAWSLKPLDHQGSPQTPTLWENTWKWLPKGQRSLSGAPAVELAGNPPSGTCQKLVLLRMVGKTVHKEVAHQRHSAKKPAEVGARARCWLRGAPHCQALEKPTPLRLRREKLPAFGEPRLEVRSKSCLLQHLSGSLYWKTLAWQPAKEEDINAWTPVSQLVAVRQ